jgi:hypothetical protein
MGSGAGPVQEGETRRCEKSRLVVGNWIKRAIQIYKRVSNFQNLRFKQNLIEFKQILFKT